MGIVHAGQDVVVHRGEAIAAGDGPAIFNFVETLRGAGGKYDQCFEAVNRIRGDLDAAPLSLSEFDAILYEAEVGG